MRTIEPREKIGIATMTIWVAVQDMDRWTVTKAVTTTKLGLRASRFASSMKTGMSFAGIGTSAYGEWSRNSLDRRGQLPRVEWSLSVSILSRFAAASA